MKVILIILSIIFSNLLNSQNLNEFFIKSGINGSITIFDLEKDKWIFSDSIQSKKGSLPASTFKIINSLIGLEEKVVKGKNDTIRWDGQPKYFKTFKIANWNKDNDMEMAFKNSTIWYYEEISKQIKKRKYKRYLKKSRYSDREIESGQGNDFWNYGNLKVTPTNQIELLVKLYKNELPFKDKNQELTRELMLEKETSEYRLSTKTGWCYDKIDIGWYIGYIELEDNVVFFATRIEKNLETEKKEFSRLRKTITNEIIHELYSIKLSE